MRAVSLSLAFLLVVVRAAWAEPTATPRPLTPEEKVAISVEELRDRAKALRMGSNVLFFAGALSAATFLTGVVLIGVSLAPRPCDRLCDGGEASFAPIFAAAVAAGG